jgi:hypothetical protein
VFGLVSAVVPSAAGASTPTVVSHHPVKPAVPTPRPPTAHRVPASPTVSYTGRALPSTPRMAPRSAVHQTFTVDSAGDATTGTSCASGHRSGTCTLRAAVAAADADAGHVDAISIPSGMTVVLSQRTELDITNSMFIDGAGASVNGDGAPHVFYQGSGQPQVEISGLAITGGNDTVLDGYGGGVYCDAGSLTLSQDLVYGNAAEYGGGLYAGSDCAAWLLEDAFSHNSAYYVYNPVGSGPRPQSYTYYERGGGAYFDGPVFVEKTAFGGLTNAEGNLAAYGAGFYNDGVTSLSDVIVEHNATAATSESEGAGVFNADVLQAVDTEVGYNTISASSYGYGAGIVNYGDVQLTSSLVVGNTITGALDGYGGGLYDGEGNDPSVFTNVSFVGNSIRPASGDYGYGGAIYTSALQFAWNGGSIVGTRNGTPGDTTYIEGGAIYANGGHQDYTNVDISGTVNGAGASGYVYGGALDNENSYASFNDVNVTSTSNQGCYISGGAIYNDEWLQVTGGSVTYTVNNADGLACGYQGGLVRGVTVQGSPGRVEGGAITNQYYLGLSNLLVEATTSVASGPNPSAAPNIYGGAIYNGSALVAETVWVKGTVADAQDLASYVYGGAFDNESSASLRNVEFVGVKTTAGAYVYGGLVYNDDYFTADNFTVGSGLVTIVGDGIANTYADGTVLYNDDDMLLTNATFDDVLSTVPAASQYSWAIENGWFIQMNNSTIANDRTSGPAPSKTYPGGTWLVWADARSQLIVRNTIVSSPSPGLNCGYGTSPSYPTGVVHSAGWSLDNGRSCGFVGKGDRSGANPMVRPLANNGGPIETAALTPDFYGPFRAGSAAINAGDNASCANTDARGLSRPQEGTCDMGAYEVAAQGYDMTAPDGGLFHFGAGHFYGSVVSLLNAGRIGPLQGPISAVAPSYNFGGYYQAGADGGVFAFGDSRFTGSIARLPLAAGIVGIATMPDGYGYWTVGAEGHVYPFGSATFYGSEDYKILHERVVGIVATADGQGYWLATADGHVLAYGDAVNYGSPAASGIALTKPVVAIAATPDGFGYWLVAADGGIFRYGDAKYYGSMGGRVLNKPIVAMASTPDGLGYWLFASDGGVFPFGDAKYLGSLGGVQLARPIVGAASANGF